MKGIFDYIDGNSFLATTIGIAIGWLLNVISTLFFNMWNQFDKKRARKERVERENFKNKPEIICFEAKKKGKIDASLFVGVVNIKFYSKHNYVVNYSKTICNKDRHAYKDYIFKNIGKSDINMLDIVSTDKRLFFVIDYDSLDSLVKDKSLWYDFCYDQKIRVGQSKRVRIYFERQNMPSLIYKPVLSCLFVDANGNFWEQPFFYEDSKLYFPHAITDKEYVSAIRADNFYEHFKKGYNKREI